MELGGKIKQDLITLTRELGFAECRIARASKAEHGDFFRSWIEAGNQAEMQWMERRVEERCDPSLVLEGVQSVIVLATNYFSDTLPQSRGEPQGRIAGYAVGDDYHEVLKRKLRRASDFLEENGGSQRAYTDTGPILERDWATQAGLGWSGKSSMQIHPKLGAWFFLSVIFTTLELPVDEKYPNRCGSCTRCMDVCPTQAIMAPHTLDARKCISYWTIEHRGSIPVEMRRLMGDRIFGCDDCLAVCPWNRFAQSSQEAVFQLRDVIAESSLIDYLKMSEEDFRLAFRKSPIKRTKWEGFLRNVCVASGNIGDASFLPALNKVRNNESSILKEHAQWAIDEIKKRII